MIALLHTAYSNVERFDRLANEFKLEEEIKHFVNEDLLTFALNNGKTDHLGFNQEIEKYKS